MAIVVVANLAIVVFDLTYVAYRNFWLQGHVSIPLINQRILLPVPQMECPDRSVEKGTPAKTVRQSIVTCLYDSVKGIEPHSDTRRYLDTVTELERQVAETGVEAGLRSPEVQATLATLRQLSSEMITANPFQGAAKSGTLEKIKNDMRRRVRDRTTLDLSAINAFNLFWSTTDSRYLNYLSPASWSDELTWFNEAIKPLIQTNYFRTIGENGEPTNNFWLLDAPFILLFLLEFIARTFYISRRYTSLTWLDAMIWRWYDVPLFLPFSLFVPALALTRAVPAALRLDHAEVVDLEVVNAKVRGGVVSVIAEEMTEIIVVQVINQAQNFIRRGELVELLDRLTSRRYVDINNINEIEAIAKHFIQLLVYQVMPKVQPDLEALLSHSITTTLSQSTAYRGLTALPGIGNVPGQITDRLVADLTQATYNSLKVWLEDPQTIALTTRLIQNFNHTLTTEAQQQRNLEEIQILLFDLLEEIKINYVQSLSQEDVTLLLDQTRQLKQQHKP